MFAGLDCLFSIQSARSGHEANKRAPSEQEFYKSIGFVQGVWSFPFG